jgi:FkbM family methyltransferase
MLQMIKDFVTSTGADRWARPLWHRFVGYSQDRYDVLTKQIISTALSPNSVCIDIGCHKGLILDMLIAQCPAGTFYAFEPIPNLFNILRRKYRCYPNVHLSELALFSEEGTQQFFLEKHALGRSGLRNRLRSSDPSQIQQIDVKTETLDDVLGDDVRVNFMKVDVEGAEFGVFQGGKRLITNSKPLIVFEFGLGGAPLLPYITRDHV